MKAGIRIISVLLCLFFTLNTAFCAGTGTGESEYSHTVELVDGFSYKNEISFNPAGGRVESYKLCLDRSSKVKPIILSADKIINAMTVNEVTAYAEDLGYTVLGVINTDFFSMQTYVPLGIVIEDGIYKSSPSGFNAFMFSDDGPDVVEGARVYLRFSNERTGEELVLENLNKVRQDIYGIYVFTSDFSETTETFTDGWAVRCSVNSGEVRIGTELSLTVSEIVESGRNYVLNDGEILLSASVTGMSPAGYASFEVGDEITLSIEPEDECLISATWATGCGDILVSEGEKTDDKNWDSAIFGYNPRTAVGIREDGSIVTYTVDGRNNAHSVGAKLSEIAADLIDEGCVTVVNMDGGGSTALNVKIPGEETAITVDEPSSNRKCSTYMIFVLEEYPSGQQERMILEEDGAYILADSAITLNYFYVDNTLSRVGNGFSRESRSPSEPGAYNSPNTGTVYVVSAEDCDVSILSADTGKKANLADLESGSEVQLSLSLKKLTRDVLFNISELKYTSEGCAEVSEDGLVSVTGSVGDTGSVTVSAGDLSVTLPVNIPIHFEDTRGHWSRDHVEAVYREGIVIGYPDGGFHPDAKMSRGDFILMLYRAVGEPTVEGDDGFDDVEEGQYYYDAILWAAKTGVIAVSDGNELHPGDALSREEAFTLLYNAASLESGNVDTLTRFSDYSDISEYAQSAVAALVDAGIVVGMGGNVLSPKGTITRGEMSKIIVLALYGK